jgi:hypothetical protein
MAPFLLEITNMDYSGMLGAIYVALSASFSDEGQRLADDVLLRVADRYPPDERTFLRALAGKKPSGHQPLTLIQGGAT